MPTPNSPRFLTIVSTRPLNFSTFVVLMPSVSRPILSKNSLIVLAMSRAFVASSSNSVSSATPDTEVFSVLNDVVKLSIDVARLSSASLVTLENPLTTPPISFPTAAPTAAITSPPRSSASISPPLVSLSISPRPATSRVSDPTIIARAPAIPNDPLIIVPAPSLPATRHAATSAPSASDIDPANAIIVCHLTFLIFAIA